MGKYTPLTPELKKIPYVRRPLDPSLDPKERKRIRDRERRAWIKMIQKQNLSISPKKAEQSSQSSGLPPTRIVKNTKADFLVEDVEGAQSSNMKLDPAKFEAFLSKRTCPKEESRNALYQLMEHFLHLFQQKDKKKIFQFHTNGFYHPSFTRVVTKHMDFFTLKKNMRAKKFNSLSEFIKDFELMCENSINYNLPGSVYFKVGKDLLDFGRKTYSKDNLKKLKNDHPELGKILLKDFGMETAKCDPAESVEKIVARAKAAAHGAANKLQIYKPADRDRFVRQRLDGTTSLSILPPSQGTMNCAVKNGLLATLGNIVGRVPNSNGELKHFTEDSRNICSPISSLNYGVFSTHLPQFDSTFSNVTEKDMKLISSSFTDCSTSEFLKGALSEDNSCDYDAFLCDRLLDIMTEHEHQKTTNYLAEEKLVRHSQIDSKKSTEIETEVAMDTDPDTVDSEEPNQEVDSSKGASSLSSDIDFEALKSLSQDGIDMSFLDELKEKLNDKGDEDGDINLQEKLDQISSLLHELQKCQNERLAIEIPSLLSQLHSHQPTDLEEKFAEEIKRNLKGLASKAKPEDVVPQETVRRILGFTYGQAEEQTSVTTEESAVLDDAESIGDVGQLGEHEVTDEVGPESSSDSC